VAKNKVPLAEEVVLRSNNYWQGYQKARDEVNPAVILGIYMFSKLVERGQFQLADHYYGRFQLQLAGLRNSVSDRDIAKEFKRNSDKFLSIPGEISDIGAELADGTVIADDGGVRVYMVDSHATLLSAAAALNMTVSAAGVVTVDDALLRSGAIVPVGIDAEWHYKQPAAASLLQVAVARSVLLFDFHALSADGEGSRLAIMTADILQVLCSSPSFAICTWGFETSDRSMLGSAGGGLFRHSFEKLHHHVSLDLWAVEIYKRLQLCTPLVEEDALCDDTVAVLVTPGRPLQLSLSFATHFFLNKPLDKREQLSNWNARPLSSAQMSYAALDAYCLLGILDCMLLYMGLFATRPSQCESDLFQRLVLQRLDVDTTGSGSGSGSYAAVVPSHDSLSTSFDGLQIVEGAGTSPTVPGGSGASLAADATGGRGYLVARQFLGEDYVNSVLKRFESSYVK
jgi:hypothetical protein